MYACSAFVSSYVNGLCHRISCNPSAYLSLRYLSFWSVVIYNHRLFPCFNRFLLLESIHFVSDASCAFEHIQSVLVILQPHASVISVSVQSVSQCSQSVSQSVSPCLCSALSTCMQSNQSRVAVFLLFDASYIWIYPYIYLY